MEAALCSSITFAHPVRIQTRETITVTILNVFLLIKKANIHKLQNFIITNKFLGIHHKPDERRGVELRASEIKVQVAGNAGREGVVGKINTGGIEKESAHEVLSVMRIFGFI